jgi:hypothetical protein
MMLQIACLCQTAAAVLLFQADETALCCSLAFWLLSHTQTLTKLDAADLVLVCPAPLPHHINTPEPLRGCCHCQSQVVTITESVAAAALWSKHS